MLAEYIKYGAFPAFEILSWIRIFFFKGEKKRTLIPIHLCTHDISDEYLTFSFFPYIALVFLDPTRTIRRNGNSRSNEARDGGGGLDPRIPRPK